MNIVRCPHCTLPLTAEEARGGTCPVCEQPLTAVPPATEQNPAARASALPPVQTDLWQVGAALLVLLLALGGLWLAFLQSFGPSTQGSKKDIAIARAEQPAPPVDNSAVPVAREQPAPAEPQEPAPAAGPEKTPTDPVPSLAKEEAKTPPPPEVKVTAPVEPKKAPDVKAPAPAPPGRAHPERRGVLILGDKRRLFLPAGEYQVEDLNNGERVLLSGRVRTLRVGLVDNGSTLDASELDVQEILLTRKIDGRSTVRLQAPSGTVAFGDRIDGDSRIIILARKVVFRGVIGGSATQVLVALTKGGLLHFQGLDGQVRLHYKKVDADDPEPRVEPGWVRGGAQLKRLD